MKKYFSICCFLLLMCASAVRAMAQPTKQPFTVKGFHIDLRIQVMKMPALKALATKLSRGGVNTIIMEWEASYPYTKHADISSRYRYTPEEVRSFIDHCRSLKLEVIPLQQSFGHVEYILQNYKYADLREDSKDYSQIDPLKAEAARALFGDLYKDMTSTHRSQYVHIGGDETYLLGHSEASKKKVAEVGIARLYGDYVKMLCELVVSLGKRPIIWADMALKYPEALKDLPKETVLVDWNYGWKLERFGDPKNLIPYGFEIWGAPAIRSGPDNYFITNWNRHFDNLRTYMPQAAGLGYQGIVMTSWSTSGIYSQMFESLTDITYLHAVRHVYPITGFNMLIDAYLESLKTSAPSNSKQFIINYAEKKYGLSATAAQDFYKAISATAFEINQGKITPGNFNIQQILDSAVNVASTLKKLQPQREQKEFAHYRLMADMRVQYLKYMQVEMQFNSPNFTAAQIPAMLTRLRSLNMADLDQRFIALNQDTFYLSELKEENNLRNQKIVNLINRLSRNRN